MHRSRLACIVIDCQSDREPGETAQFWAGALGLPIGETDPKYADLAVPEDDPRVLVQCVEHDSRVHLDIETDDIPAEVARLEALGATRVAEIRNWVVMQAPTGQRFCVVKPQRRDFASNANVWP